MLIAARVAGALGSAVQQCGRQALEPSRFGQRLSYQAIAPGEAQETRPSILARNTPFHLPTRRVPLATPNTEQSSTLPRRWYTSAPAAAAAAAEAEEPSGFARMRANLRKTVDKWSALLPATHEAPESFNRWLMVAPGFAIHLCLGSLYTFSLLSPPLALAQGVVAPVPSDWSLSDIVPAFSCILVAHGLSAALLGSWQDRVGIRATTSLGAVLFGSGMLVGALGAHLHSLPLFYLGYGLIGGLGLGFSYVPPIAQLIKWFPDKRGLASGIVMTGFGGGAFLISPITTALLKHFSEAPQYVGAVESLDITMREGRRFVELAGETCEVAIASASDLVSSGFDGLEPGAYLVGTGSTGCPTALAVLGASYLTINLAAAMSFRNPPKNHAELLAAATASTNAATADASSSSSEKKKEETTDLYIAPNDAMRTLQFWQQWLTLGSIATSGFAMLSVAKTLMIDIFGRAMPDIVTPAFAAAFISSISLGNLVGRLLWSAGSDRIGRKASFALMTLTSAPIYLIMPSVLAMMAAGYQMPPLIFFTLSTIYFIGVFGGTYSTMPAYEADIFGFKSVGGIHGRIITANVVAGSVGPYMLMRQRDSAIQTAIDDLLQKADPAVFEKHFGLDISRASELIDSKILTINSLLEILPPETLDPTPYLYNSSMYSAAALLAVAAVANQTIRPIKSLPLPAAKN